MKFEELTEIWNSPDMELEKSVQINRQLVKQLGMKKVKSHLFEIKWSAIFEIVTQFVFAVILIGFMVNHFAQLWFYIPATILLGFTLFSLIVEIIKLSLFLTLDSGSAVVESQKKLSRLKYFEMLDINSLYVIVPLFPVPFLIVFAKLLFGYDLYQFDVMKLFLYSLLGGLLVAVIIVYFLKKFRGKNLDESISFLEGLNEIES